MREGSEVTRLNAGFGGGGHETCRRGGPAHAICPSAGFSPLFGHNLRSSMSATASFWGELPGDAGTFFGSGGRSQGSSSACKRGGVALRRKKPRVHPAQQDIRMVLIESQCV